MSGDIISQPSATLSIIPAVQTQSTEPHKVLFIGQKTASGSATSGQLVSSIGNASEENALFGRNSMLAGMIRAAKLYNGQTRFDAIPLTDAGAGTQAAGVITLVGGPATAAGTFTVVVGSEINHQYTISVASGDTITVVGDAIVAAITADTNAPFTAVNVAGVVTVTYIHKGTVGNKTSIKIDGTVAGITHSVTGFTGGATDPTLTGLFDVISGERYQTIVWPSEYGFTTLTNHLDPLFNATNDVLDGVGITTKTDTLANLKSAGDAENSKSLTIFGNNVINDTSNKGSAMIEFDYVISSQVSSLRSLRLTTDANISQYVISTFGARDSFGGPALASLPYFNTPFAYLPTVATGKGFTAQEIEELQASGISVLGNNRARNGIIAGEVLTTRKTDAAGNPEDTFKYLNNVDTAVTVREFMFNNIKTRFAQSRLTDGDVMPNRNMANKAIIEAFLDSMYGTLAGEDYVLTQAGDAALNFFKRNRTVTLDLINGKVTIVMQVPIVVQLREIIATIQIAFSTEG